MANQYYVDIYKLKTRTFVILLYLSLSRIHINDDYPCLGYGNKSDNKDAFKLEKASD